MGDLENAFYIEAIRELAYEEGPQRLFVALTYILEPRSLGEQKSKAAQLGIKQLMHMGIQPDIIVCCGKSSQREGPPEDERFWKCAFERVVSMHDSASIYSIPGIYGTANWILR